MPAPESPAQNGRARCLVCDRYYQHGVGPNRTARHLASRAHRDAAAQLGLDPSTEHAERARCVVCGGVANNLRRHTRTRRHLVAALGAGLPSGIVDPA